MTEEARMKKNPLIIALDTPRLAQVEHLAHALAGQVGLIKLGLEFFTAHGPGGIRQVQKAGIPVFLDLKFHDIPNTVAGAVREATKLGVRMLTVHASGGPVMLRAAQNAAEETAAHDGIQPPVILGVTILTSMDAAQLTTAGFTGNAEQNVLHLARAAHYAGLKGLVCSPLEVKAVREAVGPEMLLVTPGIRPQGSVADDQSRTLTPRRAIAAGADYLVIGRPITRAENPLLAAQTILKSLN